MGVGEMIFKLLGWAVLIVLGGISGAAGLMFIDKTLPVVVYEARVLTKEVELGGDLKILWKINRLKICPTVHERWIFDFNNERYTLETRASITPGPLGEDAYVTRVPLPQGITVGEARYRVISTYKCNPMQWLFPLVKEYPDMAFRITH